MRHIDFRDRFTADDVADPTRRKGVFREMAKDLLRGNREGAVTDAPGAISRLMELAYKAGIEAGKSDLSASRTSTSAPISSFTELDLASLTRSQIPMLRLYLFGELSVGRVKRLPDSNEIFAFKRPKAPGLPSTMSRDEWLIKSNRDGFSGKVFAPLIKSGMYQTVEGMFRGGWEVAFLTERGYELLRTGETCRAENYRVGGTRTFDEYRSVMPDESTMVESVVSSAVAMGLMKPPESVPQGPSR